MGGDRDEGRRRRVNEGWTSQEILPDRGEILGPGGEVPPDQTQPCSLLWLCGLGGVLSSSSCSWSVHTCSYKIHSIWLEKGTRARSKVKQSREIVKVNSNDPCGDIFWTKFGSNLKDRQGMRSPTFSSCPPLVRKSMARATPPPSLHTPIPTSPCRRCLPSLLLANPHTQSLQAEVVRVSNRHCFHLLPTSEELRPVMSPSPPESTPSPDTFRV